MIFLEFSKRFFTFYFWELECFFVLKRCFSLRPFQWYIVRLATRTGSVSNPNRRIWPYYRLLPPGRRDPHVRVPPETRRKKIKSSTFPTRSKRLRALQASENRPAEIYKNRVGPRC